MNSSKLSWPDFLVNVKFLIWGSFYFGDLEFELYLYSAPLRPYSGPSTPLFFNLIGGICWSGLAYEAFKAVDFVVAWSSALVRAPLFEGTSTILLACCFTTWTIAFEEYSISCGASVNLTSTGATTQFCQLFVDGRF